MPKMGVVTGPLAALPILAGARSMVVEVVL
jgi:hypothetical protein